MRWAFACISYLGLVSGNVFFSETFDDGWQSRWTQSTWMQSEGAQDRKFFGISHPFDSFTNKGKTLIIQYQAKYENAIECGGVYVKVGPKMLDASGGPMPYHIMFGPEKCGSTKRTQLIFSYKGKHVLKTSDLPYKQEGEGSSHLYRLVLKPDNTVVVDVDGVEVYRGGLKEDWELLPPKEIKDPHDKKPNDWVDSDLMADPKDWKPKDWVDEKRVADAQARKPDYWDNEKDGKWEAPMTDNPAYKGEWLARQIHNPEFQGIWEAKMIANPEYKDDDHAYEYRDFGFIGFDSWQVKGGSIFDNVIITDDFAEADAFANKWKALSVVEPPKKREEATTEEGITEDDSTMKDTKGADKWKALSVVVQQKKREEAITEEDSTMKDTKDDKTGEADDDDENEKKDPLRRV